MARLFSDEEIKELADALGLDFSGDYEIEDSEDSSKGTSDE